MSERYVMRRPHEETWRADSYVLHVADGPLLGYLDSGGGHEEQEARARLAAQAPAMARLLLTAMADRHCAYCDAKVDRYIPVAIPDPDEAGEPLVISGARDHGKTCQLVAVLKAAGVLE